MISRSLYLQLKVPIRCNREAVRKSHFHRQLWQALARGCARCTWENDALMLVPDAGVRGTLTCAWLSPCQGPHMEISRIVHVCLRHVQLMTSTGASLASLCLCALPQIAAASPPGQSSPGDMARILPTSASALHAGQGAGPERV